MGLGEMFREGVLQSISKGSVLAFGLGVMDLGGFHPGEEVEGCEALGVLALQDFE